MRRPWRVPRAWQGRRALPCTAGPAMAGRACPCRAALRRLPALNICNPFCIFVKERMMEWKTEKTERREGRLWPVGGVVNRCLFFC